jgi:hypothetical protein
VVNPGKNKAWDSCPAPGHAGCVDSSERTMNDKLLVLGLLAASLVNLACLCAYL